MTIGSASARTDAAPWQRWYWTARWRTMRTAQLRAQPFCWYCANAGVSVRATVADHIERHRGDPMKFWNGALQSLCKLCHDSCKQREESRGFASDVGADGWPIDSK